MSVWHVRAGSSEIKYYVIRGKTESAVIIDVDLQTTVQYIHNSSCSVQVFLSSIASIM